VCTPTPAKSAPILIKDGVIERFLNSAVSVGSFAVSSFFLQDTVSIDIAEMTENNNLLFFIALVLEFKVQSNLLTQNYVKVNLML
jgi:hypothetical protein